MSHLIMSICHGMRQDGILLVGNACLSQPVTTACDTTLTVYFFGENGKDVLKFDDFHR